MDDKFFFHVAEENFDNEGVTIKTSWRDMKFLKKIILRIFSKDIEKVRVQQSNVVDQINELRSFINDLAQQNEKLHQQISTLSSDLSAIKSHLTENTNITSKLLAEYNTKKASVDTKYKEAIDCLYRLNKIFLKNVPHLGRAKDLDKLQMLVNYLYNPTEALRDAILNCTQNETASSKIIVSIMDEIDSFNKSLKQDLLKYLENENLEWDKCIIFPISTLFSSETMLPYNDSDIDNDTPIYIVSLGFDFPNSNSEKVLPTVFKINS